MKTLVYDAAEIEDKKWVCVCRERCTTTLILEVEEDKLKLVVYEPYMSREEVTLDSQQIKDIVKSLGLWLQAVERSQDDS